MVLLACTRQVTVVNYLGFNLSVGVPFLTIFVSRHNMQTELDWKYQEEDEMWAAEDEDDGTETQLKRGCVVRFRVLNVIFLSETEVSCVGTIDDDYLGVLEDAEEEY
jgi:DNA-directed RNA polymerase subunit E'/Rpb7